MWPPPHRAVLHQRRLPRGGRCVRRTPQARVERGIAMIECVVDSVRVHEQTKRHVVCLKDDSSGRVLPIWIGPDQAHAISTRLYGLGTERPMTHDMMLDAFAKLGVEIV